MANTDKKKKTLVLIGAKIPADLKATIEKKAEKEDRSLSQTISRLLSSHPELKGKKQLALQS
jgi:hypothetical protein